MHIHQFVWLLGSAIIHKVTCECPETLEGLLKWSDPQTWPGQNIPGDGEDLVLTSGILLDSETARLNSITLRDGGRLVFDPEASLAKIVSGRILIQDEGYLDIGSADCPFTGNAEILLTGERDDDDNFDHPEFGKKFIGVEEGGSLEIHGEKKKSWTRLAATLRSAGHPYSAQEDQPKDEGVYIYEFDRATGQLIDYDTKLDVAYNIKQLEKILKDVGEDNIFIVVNRGDSLNAKKNKLFNQQKEEFFQMLEDKLLLGEATLDLRESWTDQNEAWFLVVYRKITDGMMTYFETIDKFTDDNDFQSETNREEIIIGDWVYVIQNRLSAVDGGNIRFDLDVFETGHEVSTIKVVDDISSWQPGDKIVIASSDFDFEQAEEVEISSIIDSNTIEIRGIIAFEHYGEVYEGVDMRAEVGLLTRNVLIHGEMSDRCIGEDLNNCENSPDDNFGGSTMAVRGFKAYNIEGAELTKMGQSAHRGHYPIHFHMAYDTDIDGTNPIIADNSIHHCFSRCITIHGTHGVHVINNVAHDTIGHCYFLEDGGEKRTVFDGNLGLTTRKGSLVPSDSEPSTFWITSPLTTLVNNAAAGSDSKSGVGIWYLFPDEPVMTSQGLGFFELLEAKHTLITKFEHNTAHSNGNLGLGLFRRLDTDHGIKGCSTYDPHLNGKDPKNSERSPVIFESYTGYKNKKANAHIRSTTVELRNFALAESLIGIKFVRNMLHGYQLLTDSVIVGETPNAGAPMMVKVMENGKRIMKMHHRSVPDPQRIPDIFIGISIDSEGPLHLRNVAFKGLAESDLYKACGISFLDEFRFGMSITSSVKGLTFDYVDNEDGNNWVCHKNEIEGPEESSMMLNDLDGSLTGDVGSKIVATDELLHSGMECQQRDNWNMSICHGNFGRFYVWPKHEVAGSTFITKLQDMSTLHESKDTQRAYTGYTVNSDEIYVMHWRANMNDKWVVRVPGLKSNQTMIIGFCMPKALSEKVADGSTSLDFLNAVTDSKWQDTSEIQNAESLDQLENDTSFNIFYDTEQSILFVKFTETNERQDTDYGECVTGLSVADCPFIDINFRRLDFTVDLSDGDCTSN